MMKIQTEQIRSISQDLQCGLKIFVNKETYEIKSIIDPDNLYSEPEFWEEELEKIENEWTDLAVIKKMESWEAFRTMENFVDEIENEKFKQDLMKILNRKSPFANFKAEIESSQYRQRWFNFRDNIYEEFVTNQLKSENMEFE